MTETNTRRLRAFRGNTPEDYYNTGLADFPLPSRMFYAMVMAFLWVFTKIIAPWKLEAAEELCREKRARIIAMNHVSIIDPVIVAVSMWRCGQPMRCVFKSELNANAFLTWLFSRVGGLPVDRGMADMRVVRRVRAALERGESVLVYPEGTRVKRDEDSQIHGSYALMASLAKAPIQPVAIVGARDLHPGSHIFVRVGPCIEWDEITVQGRRERVEAMGKKGMERVFALRAELRRDHPGKE